ncbi:MAG TPA: tricarballylate utilization 4Fe-4S protein TcuB [Gammaproteobacteria bacterium]|nr:tricarballylate utilization 4Fe-4S protein TcuB [Gammaproteobacteria bacterium]
MRIAEPKAEAARVLAVCNACRYCEQYCPAFQALEQRATFASADVNYLANLCHGCGECLYACQYAPPHEFAIDVPRTLAAARVASYEQYAWPAQLAAAFRSMGSGAALLLALGMTALLAGGTLALNAAALRGPVTGADFYAVVPHAVLAALFGGVGLLVVLALGTGVARCRRDFAAAAPPAAHRRAGSIAAALHDAFTLRHLHVAGADCVTALEVRTPWRRWLHHATAYGFVLCFAATCVATLYHALGYPAPYAYTSGPVVLGTLGGAGLVIGTTGLLWLRRVRDPALTAPDQQRLDGTFTVLLLATAVTGLLLLALRSHAAMPALLLLHLGCVLALFVTLPYGKFVHGLYRLAALVKYRREQE